MNVPRDGAVARLPILALLAGLALVAAACDDDPIDPDPSCAEAAFLPLGVTTDSLLWEGDPVLDGSAIHYYSVRPDVGGTLTIEMAAEVPTSAGQGLDPFLYLWSSSLGDPIAQGYDPTGEGPLLRVAVLTAEVDVGCYRVGASGWPGQSLGAYTIRATLSPTP